MQTGPVMAVATDASDWRLRPSNEALDSGHLTRILSAGTACRTRRSGLGDNPRANAVYRDSCHDPEPAVEVITRCLVNNLLGAPVYTPSDVGQVGQTDIVPMVLLTGRRRSGPSPSSVVAPGRRSSRTQTRTLLWSSRRSRAHCLASATWCWRGQPRTSPMYIAPEHHSSLACSAFSTCVTRPRLLNVKLRQVRRLCAGSRVRSSVCQSKCQRQQHRCTSMT